MALPTIAYGSVVAAHHFLVSEAPGYLSREQIVIASGAGKLVAGTVLGKRTRGAAAAVTPAAVAGQVGNGTVGAVTVDAHAGAGLYRVRFWDADTFSLYDPGGVEIARGATGVAVNSLLNFTVTAGATPFAAGDGFDMTLAYAAGSTEWVAAQEANNDGSEVAAGILMWEVDATSAARKGVAYVRNAEVQRAMLAFGGSPTNGYKDACYASLALNDIAFR